MAASDFSNRNGELEQSVAGGECFFMAALHSRCGHYIFALWFLSFFPSLFPCLMSAAADWISTILPRMVWP